MPDELTLGHADTTSALVGGRQTGNQPMHEYDGDSSTTAVALTWRLPPINEPMSREERHRIREENLALDEAVAEELAVDTTMANGGTYKADWRHAAGFGGVIAFLLIGLLVKLTRSNGWH